jgi:hypothetical protein
MTPPTTLDNHPAQINAIVGCEHRGGHLPPAEKHRFSDFPQENTPHFTLRRWIV